MENDDRRGLNNEAHGRLNSWIAVSVAVISVFLGVTKVKDDNIVQAMMMAKSNAVDTWAEYQSKRVKHHLAELGLNQIRALRSVSGKNAPELEAQARDYAAQAARYGAEEEGLRQKARGHEKEYDALNYRDDQFDLSDAVLSVSLAMLAVASLTNRRWLFALSWVFAGFGAVMGVAGLLGLHLHPDWLTSLLS